jgi:hypothetical protein
MSTAAIEELDRILAETDDADDALRRAVDLLAAEPDVAWAAVAFLEDGELTVGPSAGTPTEGRRTLAPVVFQGDRVGELQVDGDVDRALVELVADRIAPLVLIGWDTRGESWEP